MTRTVLVILAIQGLLLLAFSPVWYGAPEGQGANIVDTSNKASTEGASPQ